MSVLSKRSFEPFCVCVKKNLNCLCACGVCVHACDVCNVVYICMSVCACVHVCERERELLVIWFSKRGVGRQRKVVFSFTSFGQFMNSVFFSTG